MGEREAPGTPAALTCVWVWRNQEHEAFGGVMVDAAQHRLVTQACAGAPAGGTARAR